jgi:2-desacetyl-2-hydroxyethyl bacteriochlorophyllide A dehydrogenase
MKALVWDAIEVLTIREEPIQSPQADEVTIRVKHAGICGSELSSYLGKNSLRTPPVILGHEFSGEVIGVGTDVSGLAIGQNVTVNPLVYCGECEMCRQGLNQLCNTRSLIGAHRPGAYAEYVTVPAKMVSALPDGMDTRLGALTEPAGCAVRIGEIAGNLDGKDCFIVGAGPIGLLALQMLQYKGARRVFVAELDPHRLAMAKALGAETLNPQDVNVVDVVKNQTSGGVDIALDAVGTAGTRKQCIDVLRVQGTLIFSGLHEEVGMLPVADIIRKEITAKGAFSYSPANFAEALVLLANGTLSLANWTVEAPLEDGEMWFKRLLDEPGNVSKVLLVP